MRSEERKGYRNGSRKRTLKTSDGKLELKKPQIREFPFETKVFERYSRVEKALNSVILESYIQGVSTRNVMNVVESLGIGNISASYVSSLASELDAGREIIHGKKHREAHEIHLHRCNILQGA